MVNKSLYALIQSLGKAEKRYIKLYSLKANEKKKSAYLRLFNEISNSEGIRSTVPSLQTLSKKKTNNIQNYLYQLILDALISFNNDRSISIQLRNILTEVDILNDKNLHGQSLRKLERAEELANKFELSHFILEINAKKQAILIQRSNLFFTNPRIKEKELLKSSASQKKAIEDIRLEIEYRELSIFYFADPFHFSSEERAVKHLNQFLKSPVANIDSNSLTLDAWTSLYTLKTLGHFFAGKYKEGVKYAREGLRILDERYPGIEKEYPIQVIALIYNYIGYCYFLKQYDEMDFHVEKIKNILKLPKANGNIYQKTKWSFNYFIYKYIVGIKTVNLTSIATQEKEAKTFLASNKTLIDPEYSLRLIYLFAYYYFMSGNYKEATFWLNKIITGSNPENSPDYQVQTRILYFIIIFERRKKERLEQAIEQYIEYIEENSINGKFESAILALMNTLITEQDSTKSLLIKSKKQFIALKNDGAEKKKVDHYFDYVSWIESKIEQKPFLEIYKKQNGIDK